MSRIGNNPISVPDGVDIDIQPKLVTVKGKLGELTQEYSEVEIKMEENTIHVTRPSETKGFTKELELVGVGYRASNQGQKLDLALGFSHNILIDIAPEVKVETVSDKGKNPLIKLTSHDKQLVGYIASKIRSFRRPEPYKGKGVKYVGEQIRRKAGKSA